MTSRLTPAKPASVTTILCVPWSMFRNRNSPWLSDVVTRVPSGPESVAVTPGSTACDSSVTLP